MVLRHRAWRQSLVDWARAVRDRPYVWGETDCAALVRSALYEQFDQEMFPMLPHWASAREAAEVWINIREAGGISALLERTGARQIGRRRHRWPMGTILILDENVDKFPALGIYVAPAVVHSAEETGVRWADPIATATDVASAWLLEEARVNHG